MSPKAILEEVELPYSLGDIVPPSPARSTTSSSSGSYDLEDAMPDPTPEPYPTAPLSGHTSAAELEHDVSKTRANRIRGELIEMSIIIIFSNFICVLPWSSIIHRRVAMLSRRRIRKLGLKKNVENAGKHLR